MNTIRSRLKFGIPIALFAAVAYFVLFTEAGSELRHGNVEQLADLLHSFGIFAVIAGMLAIFFQTWFPFVPFVLLAGANAYVFGLCGGFAINYVMSCAAAVSAFVIARYVAHDYVEGKLAKYASVQSFNRKLERHGFFYTLLGRLIPVIPSSLINFGAGVSKIKFRPFFVATVIGKLPIVLMETLIGHDLLRFKEHKGRLFVVLLLFVLLLWAGHYMKSRWTLKRDETDTM
ncbi:TVP38/TMEM64 family protein [Paenibacillus flagellatus]|uniref:TVP38/TMEM64 family membrane protein n=1 Tax=Paenibacillus flagellatus TaxID=2211139 RepID=A0A2V5K521_9BACL|nr:TVP38/TMEM64 family protein [Paenibacillus flagellatus]PYI54411.1 TVP38/TMEM64 family protein [Paenibacillus flagellatus]